MKKLSKSREQFSAHSIRFAGFFCSWTSFSILFFLLSLFSLPSARSCLKSSMNKILSLDPGAIHRLLVLGKQHFHCHANTSCSEKPCNSCICSFQRLRSIPVTSPAQMHYPGKHTESHASLVISGKLFSHFVCEVISHLIYISEGGKGRKVKLNRKEWLITSLSPWNQQGYLQRQHKSTLLLEGMEVEWAGLRRG